MINARAASLIGVHAPGAHPELVDLFVSAYNGLLQAWDSMHDYQPKARHLDPKDPEQARELIDRHLRALLG